jgi:hypothetical protein
MITGVPFPLTFFAPRSRFICPGAGLGAAFGTVPASDVALATAGVDSVGAGVVTGGAGVVAAGAPANLIARFSIFWNSSAYRQQPGTINYKVKKTENFIP